MTSPTNTNPYDDPQLTAYALGELEGDELAAVEQRLAAEPDAQQAVDAIRATAGTLSGALATEPSIALHDTQREAIAQSAESIVVQSPPVIFTFNRLLAGGLAAAATIALTTLIVIPAIRGDHARDEMAIAPAQQPDDATREFTPAERSDAGGTWASGGDNFDIIADMASPPASTANGDPKIATGSSDIRMEKGEGSAPARDARHSRRRIGGAAESDGSMGRFQQNQPRPSSAPPPPPGALGGQAAGQGLSMGTGGRGGSGVGGGGGAFAGGGRGFTGGGHERTPGRFEAERHRGATRTLDTDFSREQYARIHDNPFLRPIGEAVFSTFSIDVDTAAYSNVRRFLSSGQLPPPDAVRIEELINYFDYGYEAPGVDAAHPFNVNVEIADCPWNDQHRLARIGLKGKEVAADMRPATSLVFLLDVSGSMNAANKLPLVRQSMMMLVDRLTPDDKVAIVTYAGSSGLVLPSTYCFEKERIVDAINTLHPGGSTNGAAGIQLAYNVAQEHFIEGGVNRVILCTDGDFNVGVSDDGSLERLIEQKRETGVYLSVLGFGTGNFQDQKMERLSNAGNGNFAYIDTAREAKKVLVDGLAGTLVTIAKDVKIQIDFNPAVVGAYRLIGYENRMLAARDFADDTKDAGEIGAGHTVTALYEIVPVGVEIDLPEIDESKYQKPAVADAITNEMMTVKLRYKQPDANESTPFDVPVTDGGTGLGEASEDFRFAAAVASFGMILRESPHKGTSSYATVLDLAQPTIGDDPHDYRTQFLRLVEAAKGLKKK